MPYSKHLPLYSCAQSGYEKAATVIANLRPQHKEGVVEHLLLTFFVQTAAIEIECASASGKYALLLQSS